MERKQPVVSNIDSLLDSVVKAVQNKFGSDSMCRLSSDVSMSQVKKFTSFGHWGLNRICGGQGVPAGRLIELYGPYSSGKSLLIAHLLAECQKNYGIACLDDTEHAYNPYFGALLGVDNDRLLYTASETVEEVFDKMETTLTTILQADAKAYGIYGLDSIGQVPSNHEKNTALEDRSGFNTEKAIAITSATRKLCGMIGKSLFSLVVANQLKHNPAVMFGSDKYCPGGDAIPFWASIRIELHKASNIYGKIPGKVEIVSEGEENQEVLEVVKSKKGAGKKKGSELTKPKNDGPVIGTNCWAECTKNKMSKPFQKTEFSIIYDEGLQYASGCVDILLREGIVVPGDSQGFYILNKGTGSFKSDKQWRKKDLEAFLFENKDTLDSL